MIGEIIAGIVAILIIGLAIGYIVKQKKKGRKCIGCPYACDCERSKKGCNNQNIH